MLLEKSIPVYIRRVCSRYCTVVLEPYTLVYSAYLRISRGYHGGDRHPPRTDSTLLGDGVRVLTWILRKITKMRSGP